MALTHELIKQRLQEKFGDKLDGFEEPYGMLTFSAPCDLNMEVMQFLYEDPALQFTFLTDLCAVHYPERTGEELAIVYLFHNMVENVRLRFKVYLPIEQPDVFTATKIFESANWMERETYDFYGVNFVGHPNLKRIMNVDEMDYFPLRKEYPLEDQSRIDKDDEMFGRGGSYDFGDERAVGSPTTINEADKGNTWL